jgi:signal transduction histidine kinase
VSVANDPGPAPRLRAVKRFARGSVRLDDAFVEAARARLTQRTREELMRDIQAQNRELERHRENLEATVAKRTEELRSAQARAEDANRAKSEFLSNMSHELRTPLNGVLGYSQILQRDPDISDRQRTSLDAIENCGRHLLTLINDVLDLSKIEAGRLEIESAPCDLPRLIRTVYDIVRPRAEAQGLEFAVDVSPTAPRGILTDETKLKQVLVNVLGNAVKFTAEGSVRLRVEEEDDDGRLAFHVEDTGIGMTPAETAEVFDPRSARRSWRRSAARSLSRASAARARASPCRCRSRRWTSPRSTASSRSRCSTASRSGWRRRALAPCSWWTT